MKNTKMQPQQNQNQQLAAASSQISSRRHSVYLRNEKQNAKGEKLDDARPKPMFTSSDDMKVKSQHGLGRLQFVIWYDSTSSVLALKILQAKDLPAKDENGFSDPYVRVVSS